jgi:hypothetical protein
VLAGAVSVLALLGASLIGVLPAAGAGSAAGSAAAGSGPARHQSRPAAQQSPAQQSAAPHAAAKRTSAPGRGARDGTVAHAHRTPPRTSCRTVAHIGDSTSVGLISPDYLPNRAQRLRARYASVGVTSTWVDAAGGRSVVEAMPGQVNGYGVATNWDSEGFRGCWVIALGTNDTANVSVGSTVGRMGRIQEMMSAAHGQPVLWVNVKTLDTAGPWAESSMRLWNATLRQACTRYPNLRIFDWAKVAHDDWFISDGIHYTSAGYAARAQMIASALAKAFPRRGHSHGCVVG